MAICPRSGDDCALDCRDLCARLLMRPRPLGCLHFVGFNDLQRYHNAVEVFGPPDFVHRTWDFRAAQEIGPWDLAVFATEVLVKRDGLHVKYDPEWPPSPFSWDDSNQPEDPAAAERV